MKSERFRRDLIAFLESQDRHGDYDSITFDGAVVIVTEWARQEVLNDVRSGRVPASVGSFSELHDYVDANGYGGAFDWPSLPGDIAPGGELDAEQDAYLTLHCRFWDAVQTGVDIWLKAPRPDTGEGEG